MTTRDDRSPSPTDPPIDTTGAEPAIDTDDDTEGHSLYNAELGRTIYGDRLREADRIARNSARAHEAKSGKDGGILKRLRGR